VPTKTSAKTILAEQRKLRVFELRLQHYTTRQIAETVGITQTRVMQILFEAIAELDTQATAAKDNYRKFLLAEAETTERRLYETLSLVPITDFGTRMKVEEQIRKNMELRGKLTAPQKLPTVIIPVGDNALAGIDVQKVVAEVDAWTPPLQIEQHAESVSEGV
jgi:hypothetical protein